MRSAETTSTPVWSGSDLRDAFTFAGKLINHHRDQINTLNVFPVPDGDTGTNMALTIGAALEALDELDPNAGAAEVASKLAYGALMGARGNSGVILSQIFRGFSNGIGKKDELEGPDIGDALDAARETAYKAVMRPVEGTMLTVVRGAAESAKVASEGQVTIVDILHAARDGAQRALDSTPEQLDILRQAGVVDAGGQGVVYILEALVRSATGDTEIDEAETSAAIGGDMAFLDMVDETHGEDAFGYCTNFMVFGNEIDAERSRDEIAAMGHSAVIVGDETMLKVHIHTTNPGEVLAYAVQLGDLDQIKIDNMSRQTETLSSQRKAATDQARSKAADTDRLHDGLAIIAVAAGEGISDALLSLGVSTIVQGGQTMNPSTQELLAAVEESAATEVILLPNNKNIIMAANQVSELTEKTVRVVPTPSIPAGLVALTAFNTDQTLDQNVEEMSDAMNGTIAIAITRAVRDVELSGVSVTSGQTIGLINDELVTAGNDELQVTMETFALSDAEDPELLTVFVGDKVAKKDSKRLEHALAEAWPGAEIEMHDGGQPHYRYIISAE